MIKIFYKDMKTGKAIQTEVGNFEEAKKVMRALDKPHILVHGYFHVTEDKYTFIEVAKVLEFLNKPEDGMNYGTEQKTQQTNSNGCADCGVSLEKNVEEFSLRRYGKKLCRECQKKNKPVASGGYKKGGYKKGGYRKGSYNKSYNNNGGQKSSGSRYGKIS